MLERLKLDPLTALDEEGRVAQEYQAKAIPQTVVIGRDGKVKYLFVGAGARFGEQLKLAIQKSLEE